MIVVDASLVISLLIDPSAEIDAVAERLASAHLIAPAILPSEVSNVLRRRRNAGLLSADRADEAHRLLSELHVDLWPWTVVADRVWALGQNLSSYDAAYVAVAREASAILLTRDARIARAPGVDVAIDIV